MENIKPIIITGMHRSGTSLLTKILSNYIFIGSKVDLNNESIYFQRLNRWLLSSNSCSWDNPTSFYNLNKDELYILNKKLKNNINKKIPIILYFGIKNIIYNNNFFNLTYKWGWKDPVNVFTLSLWNKVFSNFKVININRNPLDVSCSLLKRQKQLITADKERSNDNLLSSIIPILSISKGGIYSSFKINSINDCLELYKKYYNQMLLNNEMFPQILNVRYENLLGDSYNELKKIYDFCDISLDLINNDIKIINKHNLNSSNKSDIVYDVELLDGLPEEIKY